MDGRWRSRVLGGVCCHLAVLIALSPLLLEHGRWACLLGQGGALLVGLVLIRPRPPDARLRDALGWTLDLGVAAVVGVLLGALVGAAVWLPEYLLPALRPPKGRWIPYEWLIPAQAASDAFLLGVLLPLVAMVLYVPRPRRLRPGAEVVVRVGACAGLGLGALVYRAWLITPEVFGFLIWLQLHEW